MNAVLVRELNDSHRKQIPHTSTVITHGIDRMGPRDVDEIVSKVREFKDFTDDNDPHGEHDFGSFEYAWEKVFWKIDYYDEKYRWLSDDPADPSKTRRVLTVMLASEY